MPVSLRKGDQGPDVTQLQQLLVQRGYPVAVNGDFDSGTYQAVRAFQSQNLDQHGQPLVVDGKVNRDAAWYYPEPKPAAEPKQGPAAKPEKGKTAARGKW